MSYKTEDLLNMAIGEIDKNKLIFVRDVIAFMGISESTFYDHFPRNSKHHKEILEALLKNKAQIKAGLRGKWYKNDNATTQIALYRLCADDEELKQLSLQHINQEGQVSGEITITRKIIGHSANQDKTE